MLKQNSCYIYNLCARTYTMAPYPPTTCQQVTAQGPLPAEGEGERVWGK